MTHKRYREYINTEEKWLGSHPRHWAKKPLWTLFRRVKRQGFESEELLSIYREHGVIPKSSREDNFNKPSDDLSSYQLVEPGDLAVNKMKAWQGSVAISEHRGIVSPAYHVYTPLHSENSRFLHYLMRCDRYITCYLSMSKGIRVNQWDLQPEYHSRMPVLLPPLDEQLAIASFLDRETAKIDALIAEQQRLIELLQEKRQAVISHAVTKGLNPNAPMKDSGVEWLGEVPEHWEVKRLKHCIDPDRPVTYGILKPGEPDEDGMPMIRAQDYSNGWVASRQILTVSRETEAPYERSRVREGDLLITAVGAGIGNCSIVPACLDNANISRASCRISVNKSRVSSEYLLLVLMSRPTKTAIELTTRGAAQPVLNNAEVENLITPLPPLREQMDLASELLSKLERFDEQENLCSRQVEILQERRSALISAAVTGQIDVRGLVMEAGEQ
jgi:type I restriction enzyme S subunit